MEADAKGILKLDKDTQASKKLNPQKDNLCFVYFFPFIGYM